jgi:hypothetical protein
VLDCFTIDEAAYNYAPIVKASKAIPKWWKALPSPSIGNASSDPTHNNNMRRCYGFVELFKRGLILENWGDIHIRVEESKYTFWTATRDKPGEHLVSQYQGAFDGYHHIKLTSPWLFRESTGVHFSYIAADWCLDAFDFKVLPGVIEYRVNRSTNVNIMLPKRTTPYDIYLPLGQPLVQMIPLNDAKLDIRMHLVDEHELGKISNNRVSTFRGLREQIKLVNRNDERRDSKCPFG